jgi:membrane protease YdiL (CAAX protease family)
MFISKVEAGEYKWYHYILTIIILIVVMQVVGLIPLIISIADQIGDTPFSPELLEELMASIQGDDMVLFTGVSFVATLVAFVFCVRYIHKQSAISYITSREKVDFKRIGLGFMLIVLLRIPLLILEQYLYGDSFMWNFKFTDFSRLLLICIMFIPIQAAFEEIFFRGYLLKVFYKITKKKYLSIAIASILFTVVHFANPEAISFGWKMFGFYLITAIFLALLVLFDNGTELAIGIHAGINIFTLVTITSEWSSFNTSALFLNSSREAFELDVFLISNIVYPLIFLILAKKYNWKFNRS